MPKNDFSLLGGLLKSSGLGVMAAAIAMMALPADALAQDRGGQRWRSGGSGSGGAVQTQNSGGGWRGGSAVQTERSNGNRSGWNGGGSVQNSRGSNTVQTPRNGGGWSGGGTVQTQGSAGRWNGGNATQAPRPNRRSWTGTGPAMPRVDPDQATRSRGNQAVQTPNSGEYQSWRGGSRNWQRNGSESGAERNPGKRDGRRDGNWRDRDNGWRDGNRNWRNRGDGWRDGNRNWRGNGGQAYNRDYRRWDRNWRANNRYDWRDYRSRNHNIYRIGRYYSPYSDYYYSRLSVGFFLDSLFYSSRYWIDDPWSYRLPPADGQYRWVRYYDDALLVDIYSGEVVDVIYDFFW